MDIVTLGAALNGSAEYVNSHFVGGSNIQIVDNPDGTQTINASGEVSSEDTVARADIAAIKDGETIDSFGDVETALATKANTSTTYTKTEVDTALSAKANSADVYSKSDIDTAMSAKADKSTTYTKTEVDTALDDKVDKVSGKGLSTNDYTTAEKTKLAGIAEGAEVNEIESIKVNNTTINPDANKVVNITVPTTAADVSALPDTTKYAAALSLTINSSTFVMTGQLKDQNGDNLGTAQTIDLPLESVVVGGSYNSQTKKVVLTLQNGNTIEFSVADLVSGLQTELSTSNKLNPAFIEYDSTHRAVSDTEKSAWNSKQNALTTTQLAAVNSGIDSTKVAQIETNKNNIYYNQNYGVKNLSPYNSGTTPVDDGIVWNNLPIDLTAGTYTVSFSTNSTGAALVLLASDETTEVFRGTYSTTTVKDAFTISAAAKYIRLYIGASKTVSDFMIRSFGDDTFVSYALSNAELTAKEQANENNISKDEAALIELIDGGAKNDLEFDAIGSTTYGPTYESNGVKFTLNADNTVTFERISTSYSTANCLLMLNGARLDVSSYCDGNHILSGCPSGGGGNTYEIMATVSGGAYTKRDYGTGVILDSASGIAPYIQLTVRSGFTGTATFKPMLCSKAAWDISQAYQPYRPSEDEQNVIINSKANLENIAYKTAASSFSGANMQVIFDENMFSQSNFRGSVLMMFGTQKTSVSNTLLLVDFYDGGIKNIRYLTSGTGEVITAIGTIHNNKHGFNFTADANSYTYPCCISLFANKDIQPKFTVSVVT